MLQDAAPDRTTDNIPDFIDGVKDGKEKLMGFGHRVYKNFDPRAKIIKKACDDVFEVTGVNPLLKIAHGAGEDRAGGRVLRQAQALPQRRLLLRPDLRGAAVPAGDVHGAVRHRPRTSGWLAQWSELVQDKEQKIARPKQIYTGARKRDFVPSAERWA